MGWGGSVLMLCRSSHCGKGMERLGGHLLPIRKGGKKGVDRPHSLPLPLAKGDGDPTQPFHSGNPHTHPPTISPIPCHEGKRGGDTVDDPCPTLAHPFPFLPGMENNGSVTCPHSPFSFSFTRRLRFPLAKVATGEGHPMGTQPPIHPATFSPPLSTKGNGRRSLPDT